MTIKFKLAVIKFGSSILSNAAAIPNAVHEVYQYLRTGYKVLVVISALGETTDNLVSLTKQILDDPYLEPDSQSYAELLATGELAAAALFTIALNRSGISAKKISHQCLSTQGALLDAEPARLQTEQILQSLENHAVVVLPGFIGCDQQHEVTLLGRGGSDFTAIFAAWTLAAELCVLYKDTNGIFNADPNLAGNTALPYKTISYEDCLQISYPVIQHKAVKFAQEKNYSFRVKALTNEGGTHVCAAKSSLQPTQQLHKLRVVLLGLGTVGLGIYKNLLAGSKLFEIIGIGVKNLTKYKNYNIPSHILTNDLNELMTRDCDVVIELMGGEEDAERFITHALSQRRYVITANKALLAKKQLSLSTLAENYGVKLYFSAAVAGAVPILETLREFKKNNPNNCIKSIEGILNGTCNFVLDRIKNGDKFAAAISAAQSAGFAEANPTLDLSGEDAAQKLIIISRLAFGIEPARIETTGIQNLDEEFIREAVHKNKVVRLVASCSVQNNEIVARVQPRAISNSHPLANITNENNGILLRTMHDETIFLHGKGAGRWPTAEAVYADLLDLLKIHNTSKEYAI